MARCIARRIRSGTLVGPGTNRKLRPGIKTILDERGKTKREPAALASPVRLSYAATPAPQPYGWVGRGPPRVRGDHVVRRRRRTPSRSPPALQNTRAARRGDSGGPPPSVAPPVRQRS